VSVARDEPRDPPYEAGLLWTRGGDVFPEPPRPHPEYDEGRQLVIAFGYVWQSWVRRVAA